MSIEQLQQFVRKGQVAQDAADAAVARETPDREMDNRDNVSALSTWPTIDEAASQLRTSAKTIRRRIAAGEIEAQHRSRSAGERGRKPETVCNPADIERLKPTAHVMPANAELVPARERISQPSALDVMAAAFATIASGQRQEQEIAPKRWLTPQEASQASGLSERFLRRLIRSNAIVSVKDGRTWKVDREQLESWQPPANSNSASRP